MPAPTGSSLVVPGSPATPGNNGFKKYFSDLWAEIASVLSTVFPSGSGAAQTYTPTLAGITSLGSGGTLTGTYYRVGKRAFVRVEIVLGSGFTFGSGTPDVSITPPTTPAHGYVVGVGYLRASTSGAVYALALHHSATASAPITLRYQGTNSQLTTITTSAPATLSAGGRLIAEFEYWEA